MDVARTLGRLDRLLRNANDCERAMLAAWLLSDTDDAQSVFLDNLSSVALAALTELILRSAARQG